MQAVHLTEGSRCFEKLFYCRRQSRVLSQARRLVPTLSREVEGYLHDLIVAQ